MEHRTFKEVSAKEFDEFTRNYQGTLSWDVCQIVDPPLGTWNDFRLGIWPESNVARVTLEYPDRGPRKYYIPDGWDPAKEATRLKVGTKVNIPQRIHPVHVVVCGDEWMIVRALAKGRNGYEEIPVLVGSCTICPPEEKPNAT